MILRERFRATPQRDCLQCAVIVLLLYVSSGMMFFGMNFFLHSFRYGTNTFVSMFIPALCWAVCFLLPLAVCRWRLSRQAAAEGGRLLSRGAQEEVEACRTSHSTQARPAAHAAELSPAALPLWSGRFVGLLCVMGMVDALGGLMSVYATVHVPVLVQALLIAGAPLYTFLFSKVFFSRSIRPITLSCVLSALLLLGGIALSLVPQIQSPDHSLYVSAKWLIIFVVSAMLPTLLNVVQGRFLDDYTAQFRSPMECKLTALCGDTVTQVFFTASFLPLDALPGFGASDSLHDAWEGFTDGTHCIFFQCENNFVYFTIYTLGFFLSRIALTYLNHYNPTVGAMVGQLTQPINTCLLLLFPSLNVFGQPGSWWCTLGCFVLMTCSMLLLIAWHEAPHIAPHGTDAAALNDASCGGLSDRKIYSDGGHAL